VGEYNIASVLCPKSVWMRDASSLPLLSIRHWRYGHRKRFWHRWQRCVNAWDLICFDAKS